MPIFWKFKLKKSYKPHLSAQLAGQMGTGTTTLCGVRIVGVQGSARTVLKLEGRSCLSYPSRCDARRSWRPASPT